MPGMPVFQDSPSQLKGQIFVLDSNSSEIVALKVDTTGNLSVKGTVDLAVGTDIDTVSTVSTITNDVKIINGATPLTVDLATGVDIDTIATLTTITNDVKIVNGATPLTVDLAAGTDIDTVGTVATITNDVKIVNGATSLSVGLSTGTNVIGKVESELVFTNLDAFGDAVVLTPKAIDIGATVDADSQNISKESSYNWFIQNTGTTSSAQDITLIVELSPDETTWINDTGSIITVPFNSGKMITVTNFLQYARFVITGGTAATNVISCFQAQH